MITWLSNISSESREINMREKLRIDFVETMRRHKRFALEVLFTLCFPLVGVIISLNVSRINEISFQRCLIKVVWIMLWLVAVFIQ